MILPLLGERAGVRAGHVSKHSHFASASFFCFSTGSRPSMVTAYMLFSGFGSFCFFHGFTFGFVSSAFRYVRSSADRTRRKFSVSLWENGFPIVFHADNGPTFGVGFVERLIEFLF
jgi:hypothetical protein